MASLFEFFLIMQLFIYSMCVFVERFDHIHVNNYTTTRNSVFCQIFSANSTFSSQLVEYDWNTSTMLKINFT